MSRINNMKMMATSRLGVAAMAAVAGAVVVGGVGFASIPDGSGVIHGCYKNKGTNHALSVIDSAKTPACPTGYTALNWSQTGPQGPTGATGATGPQGPAGPGATPVDWHAKGGGAAYVVAQDGLSIYAVCEGTYTSLTAYSGVNYATIRAFGLNVSVANLAFNDGDSINIGNPTSSALFETVVFTLPTGGNVVVVFSSDAGTLYNGTANCSIEGYALYSA